LPGPRRGGSRKEGFSEWHVQKIPTLKGDIDAAGYIKAGPALPPYTEMSEERAMAAAACGHRDRELQRKYPHLTARETAQVTV
jgi:4-(2-carboxyphenyl)-2-oxobut-3-enoate aldolase